MVDTVIWQQKSILQRVDDYILVWRFNMIKFEKKDKALPNALRGGNWKSISGKIAFHMDSISWSFQFQASMHPSDRVWESLIEPHSFGQDGGAGEPLFSFFLLLQLYWLTLQKFNIIYIYDIGFCILILLLKNISFFTYLSSILFLPSSALWKICCPCPLCLSFLHCGP